MHLNRIPGLLLWVLATTSTLWAAPAPSRIESCELPAPNSVTVNTITASSLSLNWSAVPGAVSYKISIYDVTDQIQLLDQYTSNTFFTYTGLDNGHIVVAGVSASSCPNGPYGRPNETGEIKLMEIIVDDIAQFVCPIPGGTSGTTHGPGAFMYVAVAPADPNEQTMEVAHVLIKDKASGYAVEFSIWADCDTRPHFRTIFMSPGVTQTPGSPGLTSEVAFSLPDQSPFFRVGEATYGMFGLTGLKTSVRVVFDIPSISKQCTDYTGQVNCNTLSNGGFDNRVQVWNPRPLQENAELIADRDNDPAQALSLSAAPNPFGESFEASFRLPAGESGAFVLTDAFGRTLQTLPVDAGAGQQQQRFDTADLPAGVYLLTLRTDQGGLQTIQLVKTR